MANGPSSSVSGGQSNSAQMDYSSVSGGWANYAQGTYSSVSGGASNSASGGGASISGGRHNEASGAYSSVSGGGGLNIADGNQAFADYSAILGGLSNLTGDAARIDHTLGPLSCISGGGNNQANSLGSSVSGGEWNIAGGSGYNSVSGGIGNSTGGWDSSVSGGSSRSAPGSYNWAAGSLFESW